MYLIRKGEVEVIAHGQVVATLGNGSYIGEVSLVYETPRFVFALALFVSLFSSLVCPSLVLLLSVPRRFVRPFRFDFISSFLDTMLSLLFQSL